MTLLDMGKEPEPRHRRRPTTRRSPGSRAAVDSQADTPLHPATTTRPTCSKGDFAACLAWAGDVVQLKADNPDIDFVIPDSGLSVRRRDNMLIPNKARHNLERRTAHRLLLRAGPRPRNSPPYINYVVPGRRGEGRTWRRSTQDAGEQPADHSRRRPWTPSRTSFRSSSSKEDTRYEEKFAQASPAA